MEESWKSKYEPSELNWENEQSWKSDETKVIEQISSLNKKQRETNARSIKSKGKEIDDKEGQIGGAFEMKKNADFLARRLMKYQQLIEKQKAELESNPSIRPKEKIVVTFPDKSQKEAVSWETTPMDLAKSISKGLAESVIVANILYSRRVGKVLTIADASGMDDADRGDGEGSNVAIAAIASSSSSSSKSGNENKTENWELWDLHRPLEGDCEIQLLKYDDPKATEVFWHSSAHILGECLELEFGSHLTVGPPLQQGFYYDSYMGSKFIDEKMKADLEEKVKAIIKEKQVFERIVLTKDEALELFSDNPFKVSIIQNKVKEGSYTSAYKCGSLIDLCLGPHVPDTGRIKEFMITKLSASYWLGKEGNDRLQRVYGVSFPDTKQMKAYKAWKENALENDHRNRGRQQELFFFDRLSPGCAFFEPHGARLYNCLVEFIRSEYRKRGYMEVITPNIFNVDLWKQSGHWAHYQENMFSFTDGEELLNAKGEMEGQIFALKPMNCPAHCLMFKHRSRSYKELPLRLADFGVLHRNEKSGALTGLTRVRRFQQDDAHIFCRKDQIKAEVLGALEFMRYVYKDVLGMSYKLERSTRPAKACGLETKEGVELWDLAEAQLAEVLNEFVGPNDWRDNPGDGAFYGPKIDIKVFDVMGRMHQCATIQLDFQLPINFGLSYVSADNASATAAATTNSDESSLQVNTDAAAAAPVETEQQPADHDPHKLKPGFERPVMVHRAMLGSIERSMAVLIENFGGKYPFWLNPRQAIIVPLHLDFVPYCHEVAQYLSSFYVDVDDSTNTYKKKIRDAATHGYNFILVVGATEVSERSLSVRGRSEVQHGVHPMESVKAWFTYLRETRMKDEDVPKDASALAPFAVNKLMNTTTSAAAVGDVKLKGVFTIAGQSFKTNIPKLNGKSFASLEEYSKFLG